MYSSVEGQSELNFYLKRRDYQEFKTNVWGLIKLAISHAAKKALEIKLILDHPDSIITITILSLLLFEITKKKYGFCRSIRQGAAPSTAEFIWLYEYLLVQLTSSIVYQSEDEEIMKLKPWITCGCKMLFH